jgi:hypothetical protein
VAKKTKPKNLKTKKRAGFYWDKNDRPFVSVTQLLNVIAKPQLQYWFGREVYYAMAKDPTIDQKTALAAPYKTTRKAQNRGTTVHSIVEAYKHGKKIEEENVPEEFVGYVKAFYKFIDDIKPEFKAQEKTVFSDKYGYAGTLDLLLGLPSGAYVIDVKTSKDIYAEAFMQGSAYQNALQDGGTPTVGVGVLLLKPDGDYKFETRTNTKRLFRGFIACKYLWEALNEEMLEKIGYFNTIEKGGEKK